MSRRSPTSSLYGDRLIRMARRYWQQDKQIPADLELKLLDAGFDVSTLENHYR